MTTDLEELLTEGLQKTRMYSFDEVRELVKEAYSNGFEDGWDGLYKTIMLMKKENHEKER